MLSESLDNYSNIEILYKGATKDGTLKTTARLPIMAGFVPHLEYVQDYSYRRKVTVCSDTTITFANALYTKTYGTPASETIVNYVCIPYQVILS